MKELRAIIHEVAVDGLPDMEKLVGKVAFVFDGCIVSGWPLSRVLGSNEDYAPSIWEANDDVGKGAEFGGITHWVEFPNKFNA